MSAIVVEKLGKRYEIGHEQRSDTLRDALSHGVKGLWRTLRADRRRRTIEEFWALRDVSFAVEPGEVLGIIGRNGAGKSTLLKILSRITEPTVGAVRIRGRAASLLEVGTGFHPELTGRENIFLNGAILGMSRAEIRSKFDEIIAFAEIERFLDTPVKRYSSGMYVRLAFAVAAHLEPEILIIDEVLAVGDAAFQKKCLNKMQQVATGHGRTVLFVSHNIAAVQTLCTRGLLLAGGSLARIGPTREVISHYLEAGSEQFGECRWLDRRTAPGDHTVLRVQAMRVRDAAGALASVIPVESPFTVELDYEIIAPVSRLWVGFTIHNLAGEPVFCSGDQNFAAEPERPRPPGLYRSVCHVPANLLNEDRYTLSILSHIPGVRETARLDHVLRLDTAQQEAIAGGGRQPGMIRPILQWDIRPLSSAS